MCIGDWRLGRLIRSVITQFDIATGVGVNIPANRQRVGIIMYPRGIVGTATHYFIIQVNGIDAFQHLIGMPPMSFNIRDHGDLPCQQFTAITGNTINRGSWVELFAPEDVLAAGLEEWQRSYGQWKK